MTFPSILAPAKLGRRSTALLAGLILVAAAGCHDDKGTGPVPTGTVAGTITSSLGGPISGVKITATPTSGTAPGEVTTDGDGKFSINGVPVSNGKGSISLANLPGNCTAPGAVGYSGLARGQTLTKDVEVDCRALVGTVQGSVTSSLGGTLAGVRIAVAPEGGATPLEGITDSVGHYSVPNVPVGSGSVSVENGLPTDCSSPAPSSYASLADGDTKTVDLTIPCEVTTGALTVTVTGVVDFDADVKVTGPNGYSAVVTQTTTLTGLKPGSYSVTATPVVVDDPVVISRYVAATAGNPTSVAVGDTASVSVTYAIRTGSGGLWFTNTGNKKIVRFAAGQLHETGSPMDTTSITGPSLPAAAAFDSAGNLWVSSVTGNNLVAYDRDQLVGGGTPTPIRTLSGSLSGPVGMAFDGAGNLWVSSLYSKSIIGYSAAQVAAGGSVTPATIITSADVNEPEGMAFDQHGNLWVLNSGTAGFSAVRFDASQLASGGNVAAAVKISTPGALNFPAGVAFDATGNLWISNRTSSTFSHLLVAFSPDQLTTTGTPAPAITIDGAADSYPRGIAFDQSGGLWVAIPASNQLVRYSAPQLSSSGTPTPQTTISKAAGGNMDSPEALIFDPRAPGLPIR